jgi:ADP-ribose pyrophosphatase
MGYGAMTWKRIRRDYIYRAKTDDDVSFIVDSILLPNGRKAEYTFVDCPYHVVAVVALDEDANVAIISQSRYVVDETLLEIPSGSPVKGESLVEGASRELAEEAGAEAAKFEELGTFYPSVGITNQRVTVFMATGLTMTAQNLDDMEHIEVEWTPLPDAVEKVRKGQVASQTAALAILLASLHMRAR